MSPGAGLLAKLGVTRLELLTPVATPVVPRFPIRSELLPSLRVNGLETRTDTFCPCPLRPRRSLAKGYPKTRSPYPRRGSLKRHRTRAARRATDEPPLAAAFAAAGLIITTLLGK